MDASLSSPFGLFAPPTGGTTPSRERITQAWRRPEPEAVAALLPLARLAPPQADAVQAMALQLSQALRERRRPGGRSGLVQSLLQEFALSSQEGVALMCLAEALLRIPDTRTRDALIRDKIAQGQWNAHLGKSPSLFVNAATWGLLLTGKLVSSHSESGLGTALARLVGKGGEPLIRKAVDVAMRMMGEQFVAGETIDLALRHARTFEATGFRYSYDMLGEAALTQDDARRYLADYEQAIHAIGRAAAGRGIHAGPGISIKLSALHPRYSRAQYARVMDELYPSVLRLAQLARRYDIGLNIDAEEADRLELSLDLLESLCGESALNGWDGLGFVIQAYQKRCPQVVDHLVALARRSGRRLMVRLVKGAYWDSEIKRAQLDGLSDYPVYTRKAHTDVSYLACARRLLDAPDAVYPQFATHNAHTLAAIYQMADPARYHPTQYEFQCLHGMGEPLYEQVVGAAALGRPCRIYAPVGTHETLLAYLVRRLLENGANTSFVNRIADLSLPLEDLVRDPVAQVEAAARQEGEAGLPHPRIPPPGALYGDQRKNSAGLDLASDLVLATLGTTLRQTAHDVWRAAPMLAQALPDDHREWRAVRNPANHHDVVGRSSRASEPEIECALAASIAGAAAWSAQPAIERATALERAADNLEAGMPRLMGLLIREAGKTAANAIAEVREAVDFLRFYAAQARECLDERCMPLGTVACISPWNFPLAIFTGQVAAALAAGNAVLAKPSEQTTLIAAEAVRRLWEAGVPRAALQLVPGPGSQVGAQLAGDARVNGVMFTGSTAVGRTLQNTLAQRLDGQGHTVPLIAETGGQNAMIVDSSALTEQVVQDVMASAFDSAGQRCSALRVLCVQEDVADRVIAMLKGAMQELHVGNPDQLATDVGPVIDARAQRGIEAHIAHMRERGRRIHAPVRPDAPASASTFVAPTLIELERIGELAQEIFGPVLHVVRYRREDLDGMIDQINATGYALTQGLHTRIDETIARVASRARAGNLYVNRNMVGAVVGVQPFGGEAMSGTGPKAGGPLYLLRLLAHRPADVPQRAIRFLGGHCAPRDAVPEAVQHFAAWLRENGHAPLAQRCLQQAADALAGTAITLNGPTGESNVYSLRPREAVLCLASTEADRLLQLGCVLAQGAAAVWPESACALHERLPRKVQACITLTRDWQHDGLPIDAVIHHGSASELLAVSLAAAQRDGPVVSVTGLRCGGDIIPVERLLSERALSINTAAAGGNASLMTLD